MCKHIDKSLLIDYEAVFREWEEFNIIEKVTGDIEKGHFLSHQPVVKMDSATTKTRPVFDTCPREYESVP